MYQNSNYSYVESSSSTISNIKIPAERNVNDHTFMEQRLLKNGMVQRIYRINDNHYVKYIMGPNEQKFKRSGDIFGEELEEMKKSEAEICKQILNITRSWTKK